MSLVLHVFPFSNYSEKARWGLDLSGLDYRERLHWPAMHDKAIKAMTGQTQVPVLEEGEQAIHDSSAILDRIEAISSPPWAITTESKAWEDRLNPLGALLRADLFFDIMRRPRFAAHVLLAGERGIKAAGYGLALSAMSGKFLTYLNKEYPDPSAPRRACLDALEDIVEATATTGYLAGDTLTRADITAAALFYPVAYPKGSPGASIVRDDPRMAEWRAAWAGAPALDYIRRIYAEHRMKSGEGGA